MASGWKYSSAVRSVMEFSLRSSTIWSIMGLLAMGTMGFGRLLVRGLNLVPNPPAMTTHFIDRPPYGLKPFCRTSSAGRILGPVAPGVGDAAKKPGYGLMPYQKNIRAEI